MYAWPRRPPLRPACRRHPCSGPQTLEAEREAAYAADLPRPDFGPGDVVELKLSVPENKRRVTQFKGIVIARRNASVRSTFTLRNIFGASGGIERTFPL